MQWTIRNSVLGLAALLLAFSALAAGAPEPPAQPPKGNAAGAPAKHYAPYPEPENGYVTDKAGLLTAEQKKELNAYCYTTEKETSVEVAVVTINSIKDYPGTANASIETFARGLFDTYGIGNLPRNDGVLLLVAKGDRKVRIELGNQYGHSRDADSQRIIDSAIIPRFKANDYAGGITAGTRAIIEEFAHLRIRVPWTAICCAGAAILLLAVCVSLFLSGKRGWGWVVAGIVFILFVFAFKTVGKIIEGLPEGSGVGGFGGGFGGGFSGGGGATGSW